MEVRSKDPDFPKLLSFDGRVLEIWESNMQSRRFHISQIGSVEVGSPDKHGKQKLTLKPKGHGNIWDGNIAPEAIGEVQQLIAAVRQAMLSP